jgi:hypothetical protein
MIKQNRKIAMVVNFVSHEEAEKKDDSYFSEMSSEDLLKECFDLRKLNFFNGKQNNLPRIKKVGRLIIKGTDETEDA